MELCEQINKEEDENIIRSIAHLLDIILLEENWSQGSMDTSFFLKPVWNRGEIVSNRYDFQINNHHNKFLTFYFK